MPDNGLPDGWRRVPLRDVATIVMGQAPPGSAVADWNGTTPSKGLPFIQGNAEFTSRHPVPVKWCSDPAKIAQVGDTLISVRAPVGEMNSAHRELAIGRGVAAVRFTGVDARFGWHQVALARAAFSRISQGSTFAAINSGDLAKLELLTPSPNEQRRIAEVLDSIDAAIEKTEAVIAATERLRSALLGELLTRGVPAWHTEWKQVPGIGTIPACWEVVRLGDVAEVERGRFTHRPRNAPQFYGGRHPFVQTGDVVNARGRLRDFTQTLNDDGLAISRTFPPETILMTIAANIGETAIAAITVAAPDSIVGISPATDRVSSSFLNYFFYRSKETLSRLAPQSAQKNINLDILRTMRVVVPDCREQGLIANALDQIHDAMEAHRTVSEERRSLKLAVAEALLSGRLRVPVDSGGVR